MRMEQEIIAQKLREYIRQEEDQTVGHGYFLKTMDEMQAQSANTFNRPVASAIPGVSVIKKVIRRFIAWYNNPFAQQQSVFNTAAVDSTAYLGEAVNALQEENRLLVERLDKLEAEVWKLKNDGDR